jgi:hypothetical protein
VSTDKALAKPQPPLGAPAPAARVTAFAWWLVLCMIGLDYFSTLAYLPSIAVQASRAYAPLAALGVVVVTLLAALPVYLYVVGRSPHGRGATGLLEQLVHGWRGKVFILVLLGFVGTDFVVTRTLSIADAARHLTHNPYWQDHATWVSQNKATVRGWFPAPLRGGFFDFWNEQLVVTLVLAVVTFTAYGLLLRGFTRRFMVLAAVVVGVYLLLTGVVAGSALAYVAGDSGRWTAWLHELPRWEGGRDTSEIALALGLVALLHFPQMALGLSGFELSMTSAPLVRGRPDDDPAQPRGRIRRTRWMLAVAALIMSVFLLGSVTATAHLVPGEALTLPRGGDAAGSYGPAMHRALAYLAHGGPVNSAWESADANVARPALTPGEKVNPLFGPAFGTLYDLSTVLILCLAGASVTIGLRGVVPLYLARFGMQLQWAERVGVILHLFNVAILVITIVFHASVSAQQWAYCASVLVLLTSAAVAALLDVRRRWRRSLWRYVMTLPLVVVCALFLAILGLTFVQSRSGLYIPLTLVLLVLGTGFASRWLRSTELRFGGFDFTDEHARKRWQEICQLEFQVLVPHKPENLPLAQKEKEIRATHRLGAGVPIIFIEVELGDPSDFLQTPVMSVETREGTEVIHVSRCASVAHVIAAIGLEFRKVGRPPEIHFAWSEEAPMAANLGFLLFGEGNVPWMVHALIRRAERDVSRRPRVVVG